MAVTNHQSMPVNRGSHMPLTKSLLCAAAATIAVSLAPGSAWAGLTTFDFTGECTDCHGVATAELVVQDYVPGTFFSPSNFVRFHYDGTNLTPAFTLTPGQLVNFAGSIGPSLPGAFDVGVFSVTRTSSFETGPSGDWTEGAIMDVGTNGTWDLAAGAVPEPGTMKLLSVGLAAFGMTRCRWRRNA